MYVDVVISRTWCWYCNLLSALQSAVQASGSFRLAKRQVISSDLGKDRFCNRFSCELPHLKTQAHRITVHCCYICLLSASTFWNIDISLWYVMCTNIYVLHPHGVSLTLCKKLGLVVEFGRIGGGPPRVVNKFLMMTNFWPRIFRTAVVTARPPLCNLSTQSWAQHKICCNRFICSFFFHTSSRGSEQWLPRTLSWWKGHTGYDAVRYALKYNSDSSLDRCLSFTVNTSPKRLEDPGMSTAEALRSGQKSTRYNMAQASIISNTKERDKMSTLRPYCEAKRSWRSWPVGGPTWIMSDRRFQLAYIAGICEERDITLWLVA